MGMIYSQQDQLSMIALLNFRRYGAPLKTWFHFMNRIVFSVASPVRRSVSVLRAEA